MESVTVSTERAKAIALSHGLEFARHNATRARLIDLMGDDAGWNDIACVNDRISRSDLMAALGY